MRKQLFIIIFLLLANGAKAQLSNEAKIYLVTVSPGEELYAAFGHSALWVRDPARRLDVVFNYGTFDFNTPDFYTKFALGHLDYMLSTGRMNYLVRSAQAENRSVYTQELALDSMQKQMLYAALIENYKEENRYYRYDFLFDNCSTRIRDMLERVLSHEELDWRKIAKRKTFREFLGIYTAESEWIDLSFGLILGQSLDTKATAREEMFLPDELMDGFDRAVLNGKPLVSETKTLFEAEERASSLKIFTPATVFWFVCIIGVFLSIRQHKFGFHSKWFDKIVFFATGLIGLIITVLWFFTEHHVTVDNWNIAWANPLNFILAFFLFDKQAKRWQQLYYVVFGSVCFFIMGFWYALPQVMHPAAFPLVLYMCFRSYNVFYKTKKMN